jgi:hypothetical protein
MDERFPHVDRAGYPLGVDSFVRVEMESTLLPGRVSTFQGLVSELGADGKGPVLTIREWRGGFTGKKRAARPEHCTVERAPAALREGEAERAETRRHAAERAREQEAARPRRRGRR